MEYKKNKHTYLFYETKKRNGLLVNINIFYIKKNFIYFLTKKNDINKL